MASSNLRIERDTMGEVEVPLRRTGAQTARAVQNFPIGDRLMPPPFIHALGVLKQAAVEVNVDLKSIDERRGLAIGQAAAEVAAGRFDDQFPISVFQTGSGTSSNMNANEVIASRANEILGGREEPPEKCIPTTT